MADKTDTNSCCDTSAEPDMNYASSIFHRLHWIPANMQRLAQLETSILSKLSASNVVRKSVRISDGQQLWTLIFRRSDAVRHSKSLSAISALGHAMSLKVTNSVSSLNGPLYSSTLPANDTRSDLLNESTSAVDAEYERRIPIVLVHGMGSAASLFIKNIDEFSANRMVYAFDLLGFGRSSRPRFPDDAEQVELQYVESFERWRAEMNLNQFILLGHSLGGYLAASYAAAYPDHVKHLILAEPWGFPHAPQNNDHLQNFPLIVRMLARVVTPTFPFAVLRAAGPFGPGLVERFRPDLQRIYGDIFGDNTVLEYIYECNALEPSGERAFKALSAELGWAKRPQIDRAAKIAPQVGISFIYGERSWIDSASGYLIRSLRPGSFVKVHIIPEAGHHVMAQCAEEFNEIVNLTCSAVDGNSLDKLNAVSSDPKKKSNNDSGNSGQDRGSKAEVEPKTTQNETDKNADAKLHPRLKMFPANTERPADLVTVEARPISF